MDILNKSPKISLLTPTIYSMLVNNIDINKEKNIKSIYNFLNLQNLSTDFSLDSIENNTTGFISKSYYQSNPEFAYNYPPKGPIENNFQCINCKQIGPEYHMSECRRPFDSSLVLTFEGSSNYPGRNEGTSYKLLIKKRGQKKNISSSIKSERFSDNLELIYQNPNLAHTIIRIAKNGSINIISASFDNDNIGTQVINKINKTNALNIDEYNKIYPKKSKFTIDPELTYKYIIAGQFNLYPKKDPDIFYINLQAVNINLDQTNIFKKRINNNDVFMVDKVDNYYIINKYIYNQGELSKTNKPTNPYIQIILINPKILDIKINVMIYTRGAIQLRASYINPKNHDKPLEYSILNKVYIFLKSLMESMIINSSDTEYPIILSEKEKVKKISNAVDGKQPQTCQNRKGYEIRPVPYSFYGTCPIEGYYVPPRGNKRNDGKFEPCCVKLTEYDTIGGKLVPKNLKSSKSPDTLARYQKILKSGYPDDEIDKFNETVPDANDSAIYKPGTKILESRKFKGLSTLSIPFLKDCIKSSGYVKEENIFTKQFNENYNLFKTNVWKDYTNLTNSYKLMIQGVETLTISNFDKLTTSAHIITPIYNGTLNVLLFFNQKGESFFINLNMDISESGLPIINNLSNTIIEGYLYPFEKPNFIFYPVDIIYFKKINITDKPYYIPGNKNNRFDSLMYACNLMESSTLAIETLFDLDIFYSKNFLSDPEVYGLLFIPYDKIYTPGKINKNVLLWTEPNIENKNIALNVYRKSKNKVSIKIDSKKIDSSLLPQIDDTIEINVKFLDDNGIVDNDLVLFKINVNKIDKTINYKKPLIPLEKINYKINDYFDVINILQSIVNPIQRKVFIDNLDGFVVNNNLYTQPDINSPLKLTIRTIS